MKNTIKERLFEVLTNRDWSVTELAEKTNLPLDTIKSIYYGRTNNPKLETLVAIANALNVSIDFLIGRTNYAQDEIELLKNYRQMSSRGKEFVKAMAQFERKYTEFEDEQDCKYEVPCYLPEVIAKDKEEIKYHVPSLEPTGLFKDGVLYDTSIKTVIKTHLENVFMAVKIPNDSLANTYFKGDIIFLERRRPNIGEIAIYHKDNHIYIRQYDRNESTGKHILRSLNINNKDIVLNNSEMSQYSTVGTCIYVYRKTEEPF